MAMVGVAIGLGNIWRFPYMMGAYGKGTFLAVYLVVILAFGTPCIMAEWTLGRMFRTGPLIAFRRAGLPYGGTLGALLCVNVLMAFTYYIVVVGWVALYAGWIAMGGVLGENPQQTFDAMQSNFLVQYLAVALMVAVCGVIVTLGVRRGIQRVSTIAIPVAGVLLLILVVRTLTLPGAMEGVREYLIPSMDDFTPRTFLAAIGQAFFTLSLGGTFFLIYGSYLKQDFDIPKNALATAGADTLAALMGGLIVLPAAFVFGIEPASGPPLVFVTLPSIFEQLPLGALFAVLFFVTLLAASFLSAVAAYEVAASALMEWRGWSRGKAAVTVGLLSVVLIIPPILSVAYVKWADMIFGSSMQLMGNLLVLVTLAFVIGRSRALAEVNQGATIRVPGFWITWIRYVTPVVILVAVIYGWFG
jgi:NSS family neurotransmitter:Na+ symporter